MREGTLLQAGKQIIKGMEAKSVEEVKGSGRERKARE
jgi:hypothetical protein